MLRLSCIREGWARGGVRWVLALCMVCTNSVYGLYMLCIIREVSECGCIEQCCKPATCAAFGSAPYRPCTDPAPQQVANQQGRVLAESDAAAGETVQAVGMPKPRQSRPDLPIGAAARQDSTPGMRFFYLYMTENVYLCSRKTP